MDTASVYKQMFSGEYKVRFIPVLSVTVIVMADYGYKETYDSIFFCKCSYEEHESVNVSDELLTHHDFQRFVLDNLD